MPMPVTVLYPEARQQPDELERGIFGPDVNIVKRDTGALSELSRRRLRRGRRADDHGVSRSPAPTSRGFPSCAAIVRMGVGYDKLDRPAAAARNILVCNVPDYGTTEVADHAIALALTLRRGILLHHEYQRHNPPAPWRSFQDPTDPAARHADLRHRRARPHRHGGGVARQGVQFPRRVLRPEACRTGSSWRSASSARATLEDLLRQTNTLSIHAPLTPETKGHARPRAAVAAADRARSWSTTRAARSSTSTRCTSCCKSGHIAAAGLDVLPVEPPVEPIPELLRAYRAREKWLEGPARRSRRIRPG